MQSLVIASQPFIDLLMCLLSKIISCGFPTYDHVASKQLLLCIMQLLIAFIVSVILLIYLNHSFLLTDKRLQWQAASISCQTVRLTRLDGHWRSVFNVVCCDVMSWECYVTWQGGDDNGLIDIKGHSFFHLRILCDNELQTVILSLQLSSICSVTLKISWIVLLSFHTNDCYVCKELWCYDN